MTPVIVELPADARPGQVFVVMLDAGGMPCVQLSTDTGEVIASATMPTARLKTEIESTIARNFRILLDDMAKRNDLSLPSAYLVDVLSQMHAACAANIAQGLAGRVLP